ncbi:terminase small subunit [Acinetobacter modestus]|uniref:terminase small subunit n=1 Tax=Acinetobacter modestus TaxID=1776740 RepID=UPI0032085FB7
MALTEKKKMFALAKHKGMDNKNAAMSAGCSEKTASAAATRFMKDQDVIDYLGRLSEAEPEQLVKHTVKPIATSSSVVYAKQLADPLEFLESVYSDSLEDMALRVNAAKAALPYVHGKVAEKGKKETKEDAAKAATKSGKYATLENQLRS